MNLKTLLPKITTTRIVILAASLLLIIGILTGIRLSTVPTIVANNFDEQPQAAQTMNTNNGCFEVKDVPQSNPLYLGPGQVATLRYGTVVETFAYPTFTWVWGTHLTVCQGAQAAAPAMDAPADVPAMSALTYAEGDKVAGQGELVADRINMIGDENALVQQVGAIQTDAASAQAVTVSGNNITLAQGSAFVVWCPNHENLVPSTQAILVTRDDLVGQLWLLPIDASDRTFSGCDMWSVAVK